MVIEKEVLTAKLAYIEARDNLASAAIRVLGAEKALKDQESERLLMGIEGPNAAIRNAELRRQLQPQYDSLTAAECQKVEAQSQLDIAKMEIRTQELIVAMAQLNRD